MINFVNSRDIPLALYVFTESMETRDYVFERTRSGQVSPFRAPEAHFLSPS